MDGYKLVLIHKKIVLLFSLYRNTYTKLSKHEQKLILSLVQRMKTRPSNVFTFSFFSSNLLYVN